MPHEDAVTLHGPPMIRGNRMYAAFWGGGIAIIDCTDLTKMELVGHLQWSPPFPGSTHTCWPLGDRPYLICTDEARAKQKYWDAQFMWVIDARKEDKLIPIATFMPDRDKYFNRPGRYGAHNILEHLPDGLVLVRADDTIVWCNARFSAWIGKSEVDGLDFFQAFDRPEILGPDSAPFRTAIEAKRATALTLRTGDNRYFHVRAAPGGDVVVSDGPSSAPAASSTPTMKSPM